MSAKRSFSSLDPIRESVLPKKARLDITSERTPEAGSSSASGLTKVISWNVETPVPFLNLPAKEVGKSATTYTPRRTHLRELLARHDFPDFLCLQEVRARHTDTDWIAALRAAVNGHGRDSGPRYTVYTSLNRATRGQRHFGTVTFAMSPDDIANYIGRVADLDLIEIEYVRTAANELEHENQQHGEKP